MDLSKINDKIKNRLKKITNLKQKVERQLDILTGCKYIFSYENPLENSSIIRFKVKGDGYKSKGWIYISIEDGIIDITDDKEKGIDLKGYSYEEKLRVARVLSNCFGYRVRSVGR